MTPKGNRTGSYGISMLISSDMATEEAPEEEPIRVVRKHLTTHERFAIFNSLRGLMVDGNLPRGSFLQIGRAFGCAKCTVRRVWTTLREKEANILATLGEEATGKILLNLEFYANEMGQTGRLPRHDRVELVARTKELPNGKRGTYRKLAKQLGMPLSTVFAMKKREELFKVRCSRLKPKLTEEHKLARFLYAIEQIDWPERITRESIAWPSKRRR